MEKLSLVYYDDIMTASYIIEHILKNFKPTLSANKYLVC